MAAIAVAPIVLKDVIFQVGTDSYEAACQSVVFTPSYTTVKAQGLTPAASFADVSNPEWECEVAYLQDWTTANSLSQYLLANSGTSKVVVFKPQGITTGKPIFTATLTIMAGAIGGTVNQFMSSSVTMPVTGQPVKTVAP